MCWVDSFMEDRLVLVWLGRGSIVVLLVRYCVISISHSILLVRYCIISIRLVLSSLYLVLLVVVLSIIFTIVTAIVVSSSSIAGEGYQYDQLCLHIWLFPQHSPC